MKVISKHLYKKNVCSVWRRNRPFFGAGRNRNYSKPLIVKGLLRMFLSVQSTKQPETIQKAGCNFPENVNYTGTRSERSFCRPEWQFSTPPTTLNLSQVWNVLGKLKHSTKNHQKAYRRSRVKWQWRTIAVQLKLSGRSNSWGVLKSCRTFQGNPSYSDSCPWNVSSPRIQRKSANLIKPQYCKKLFWVYDRFVYSSFM